MKVALVIERCPKCPWYSEMRGCMHNEGPVGIVENDYIINPECPLPDYVDVSKLKETIEELGSLVIEGQKNYSEKIAQLTMVEHDLRVMQKERDEMLAMLIEVRDDVCEHYNYKRDESWSDDDGEDIKSRLDRLDALIERMTK